MSPILICDKSAIKETAGLVRKEIELSLLPQRASDETIVKKLCEMDYTVYSLYRRHVRETTSEDNRDIWNEQLRYDPSNILIFKCIEQAFDHGFYLGNCTFLFRNKAVKPVTVSLYSLHDSNGKYMNM